ncbi:MAG: molybdopterin molybdotransferase MoeA [Deltaproteobacteria bacterium]|nr:molybdopterin molybdotransferase MoeA [Deltaproteobacteria bacterium]
MLSVEEAVARVMAQVPPGATERVFLAEALGRVLREEVRAAAPVPRFANSAMDGYALRAADVPGTLEVLETIAAGRVGHRVVGPGQASRIMTGAPVPEGADAVVMVEDTRAEGDRVVVATSARAGQHLRPAGADVREGEVVLSPGTVLGAGAIGLLATLGWPSVRVAARPRVAILSTGDEVVEPGFALGPGQIHSSNTHALSAQVRAAGGLPVDLGTVRDDPAAIGEAFAGAASVGDLVVSTGGVSVGDFDHVKGAIGSGMDFWKVAMKPGKPLAYGRVGGKPCFGLPGNPVSCMVNFYQFVRPVLRAMMGDPSPYLPVVDAHLSRPVKRATGRVEFLRVALSRQDGRLVAVPVGGHQGSGNVRSMAEAHGFALLDARSAVVEGHVPVQVFDWSFEAAAAPSYRWGQGAGGEGEAGCC